MTTDVDGNINFHVILEAGEQRSKLPCPGGDDFRSVNVDNDVVGFEVTQFKGLVTSEVD